MNDFPALPFDIGSTYGAASSTDGAHWEGRTFQVPDLNYGSTTAVGQRSYGRDGHKTVMVVRNVGTVALLPRRLVTFKSTAWGKQVDGYARTSAQECYPVDEFLPTAGVAVNDLFYIVIDGPAEVLTSLADYAADMNAGTNVQAITAAASTSTTAGRLDNPNYTGASSTGTGLAVQIFGRLGVALSTSLTNATNAAVLVRVARRW